MFSCRIPNVCQSKTVLRESIHIEDANLFLPHQCLLVDHETQSGPWWSACQCQRPDKDVSLPLYKSLHRCRCGVNLGLFYLWVNLRAKSNLSTAHLHSSHIKCDVVETDNSISLFSRSLQSPRRAVDIWGRWEGRSSCFHATPRILGGGGSSLTRQAELTANCCFTGTVIHKQCWEYSWLHRSVIDPLRLLLMLDVTPSHPVSHWQHLLPASIIYYFLSACTWKKCMFTEAPLRSCCLSDSTNQPFFYFWLFYN